MSSAGAEPSERFQLLLLLLYQSTYGCDETNRRYADDPHGVHTQNICIGIGKNLRLIVVVRVMAVRSELACVLACGMRCKSHYARSQTFQLARS